MNWKPFVALYVVAGITATSSFYIQHKVTCRSFTPITYLLVGAVWPTMGLAQSGMILMGYDFKSRCGVVT